MKNFILLTIMLIGLASCTLENDCQCEVVYIEIQIDTQTQVATEVELWSEVLTCTEMSNFPEPYHLYKLRNCTD